MDRAGQTNNDKNRKKRKTVSQRDIKKVERRKRKNERKREKGEKELIQTDRQDEIVAKKRARNTQTDKMK